RLPRSGSESCRSPGSIVASGDSDWSGAVEAQPLAESREAAAEGRLVTRQHERSRPAAGLDEEEAADRATALDHRAEGHRAAVVEARRAEAGEGAARRRRLALHGDLPEAAVRRQIDRVDRVAATLDGREKRH